ncbi:MAG: hypothetical protein QG602_767 [Verrucomicrobiota bacterium]|nr:hypothetical protein [Verrucomicrobiota bacterium]
MKIKTAVLLLAALVVRLVAADILPADAAVFLQPDPKSPVLVRLKAGNTILYTGDAPAGWRRVEISGTFEGYVHARDFTKGLEVKEGGSILAAPKKDAPVLTAAQEGDKTDVVGLVNKNPDWVQIKFTKKLQGFVATAAAANLAPDPVLVAPPPAVSPAPAAPATNLGRPVALTGNTADLPRLFAGRLVLARRAIINPNPPYDYQLLDSNGRRFAYIDTKRLLLTDQIQAYIDREVSVTGTIRNTVDGKDLVIAAESLLLKKH